MHSHLLKALGDSRRYVHRVPTRVELVHELQKGPVVPQTILSDTADRMPVEPTTTHTNSKEA
jgi:hypothetical protein